LYERASKNRRSDPNLAHGVKVTRVDRGNSLKVCKNLTGRTRNVALRQRCTRVDTPEQHSYRSGVMLKWLKYLPL
jgi:hypothetical protein